MVVISGQMQRIVSAGCSQGVFDDAQDAPAALNRD